jgi:hypothetical protein
LEAKIIGMSYHVQLVLIFVTIKYRGQTWQLIPVYPATQEGKIRKIKI